MVFVKNVKVIQTKLKPFRKTTYRPLKKVVIVASAAAQNKERKKKIALWLLKTNKLSLIKKKKATPKSIKYLNLDYLKFADGIYSSY